MIFDFKLYIRERSAGEKSPALLLYIYAEIVTKLRKNAFLCPYTCVYGFFFVTLRADLCIIYESRFFVVKRCYGYARRGDP